MIYLYIAIGVLISLFAASIINYGLSWAAFKKDEDLAPEDLKKSHNDWIAGFKWVPRKLTAFLNGPDPQKRYPIQIAGNNKKPLLIDGRPVRQYSQLKGGFIFVKQLDVPEPGTFCITWPIGFAWLTKSGWIIGAGIRKTYFATGAPYGYWTLRAAFHKN